MIRSVREAMGEIEGQLPVGMKAGIPYDSTEYIQDAIDETYAPVVAAVTKLLDSCVADNSVRRGLDPADVLPPLKPT